MKKNGISGIIERLAYYLMVAPGAILVFIFSYMPIVGIMFAFVDYKPARGIFGSEWVGLDNFRNFFSNPDFWLLTRNTLGYNIVFLILGTALALIFALLMNELRSVKAIKFYQTVAIMPHFLSYVIVAYLVFAFLGQSHGIINNALLPMLGIDPINWYSEAKYWPFILTFVRVWKSIGYSSIVYFAAISGINSEYYEAALIDGANRFQMAVKITLPLIRSIICIQLIMALGGLFNSDIGLFYNVPMNQGTLYSTTNVMSTYLYKNITNTGYSTAAGLYASLLGFILVLLSNAIVNKIDSDSALF